MLALSLLWLGLGIAVGALALWARLRPVSWGRYGWALLLGIGALSGLFGGWLGALLYGRFFGTAMAAWIAVLAVILVPWLLTRMSRRTSAPSIKKFGGSSPRT